METAKTPMKSAVSVSRTQPLVRECFVYVAGVPEFFRSHIVQSLVANRMFPEKLSD